MADTGTRSPTAPSRAWQGPLFLAAGLALASGIVAVSTEGALRRIALFVLLLAGLMQARLVSSRRVPTEQGGAMGGSGYRPPDNRIVRALHAFLSLAHNGGIMVVVFAALVRFDLVPLQLPEPVLQLFPLYLGVYLVLLAVAVKLRIEERGGVVHTWYTRMHGW